MDLFDSIWKNVFRTAPTLGQEEVLKVFEQMDSLLEQAIHLIGHSPVVLDLVMQLTADVVGSLSHGRGIFKRGAAIKVREPFSRKTDNKLLWHADPGQVFIDRDRPDKDAINFISSSLRLYACWSAGKMTPNDVWSVRLSRASYETIIETFLKLADPYSEISMKTAKLRLRYTESSDFDKSVRIFTKVSKLSEEMYRIEGALGFSDELFGILAQLKHIWASYRKLRDKIYIPYLRIVFNEAKRRATSEIQTIENFQNGAIGLISAISNYNAQRGVFSSYASLWATQGILLKLKEEANPIKLPAAIWQTANKLNEIAQRHASNSVDGTFDLAAVAKEAGIDERRAEKIFERIRSTQMLSIDYQSSDDPDAQSLHETVEAEAPEELPDVEPYLAALSERQRLYVMLNYGLFEQLPGQVPIDQLQMSRERLYQSIANAVNRSAVD